MKIDTKLRYRERYEGELGPSEVEGIAQLLFSWWRREFEEEMNEARQSIDRTNCDTENKSQGGT